MKKIIAAAAILLCAAEVLFAVPAWPGKVVKVQPDGSRIVIRIHGDEYRSWVTNEAGDVLEMNEAGFYVTTGRTVSEAAVESDLVRDDRQPIARAPGNGMLRASAYVTTGTVHIPVILVQFSDTTFASRDPVSDFFNMLNQDDYSANGGTGSVHDFYYENSHGKYNPVFDVYGPVTVGSFASYGITQSNYGSVAQSLIQTACSNLNDRINFANYDYDRDNTVDMILMYYAGHNMAEGGDGIWPHRSTISSITTYDGKRLGAYFCTSELKGYEGKDMCGIGTTCHEFAHSLGLPDFYDTDYEINGEAGALYSYSTMCSGPYLNDGCTPPYFSLEERIMLGWVDSDSIVEISGPGSYTLGASDNDVAYQMKTATHGEYFLYEARGYGRWDAALPAKGMVVYHVDKSTSRSITIYYNSGARSTTATPYNLWTRWSDGSVPYYNSINENGSHPCYYVIPAINTSSLYYHGDEGYLPYPGASGANQFVPVDWNGNKSGLMLRDIAYNADGSVSFQVINTTKAVYGQVVDPDGKPIAGATVRVYGSSKGNRAPSVVRRSLQAPTSALTTVTDDGGNYYLDLSGEGDGTFEVGASASGYVSHIKTGHVDDLASSLRITLCPIDYIQESLVHYCDLEAEEIHLWGDGAGSDVMASIGFTEEEMVKYAGRKLETIHFYAYGGKDATTVASKTYVLVEFGTEQKLFLQVEPEVNGWTHADVSEYNICMPEDTDVHIGYVLVRPTYDYPITLETESEVIRNSYVGYYAAGEESYWYSTGWNNMIAVSLSDSETVLTLGYNTIDNPKIGYYAVGETFVFKLNETEERAVSSVEWFFDDEPVTGDSVVLEEGRHVVEARMVLVNGKRKILEQVLIVE
ncbi:MAG: M6 family metalloprotease domain-containing protein [Bacteroidales bacterium]|nr:M6 family metalloprotease domain-containing protein [Bacteroidales bacterium]